MQVNNLRRLLSHLAKQNMLQRHMHAKKLSSYETFVLIWVSCYRVGWYLLWITLRLSILRMMWVYLQEPNILIEQFIIFAILLRCVAFYRSTFQLQINEQTDIQNVLTRALFTLGYLIYCVISIVQYVYILLLTSYFLTRSDFATSAISRSCDLSGGVESITVMPVLVYR